MLIAGKAVASNQVSAAPPVACPRWQHASASDEFGWFGGSFASACLRRVAIAAFSLVISPTTSRSAERSTADFFVRDKNRKAVLTGPPFSFGVMKFSPHPAPRRLLSTDCPVGNAATLSR